MNNKIMLINNVLAINCNNIIDMEITENKEKNFFAIELNLINNNKYFLKSDNLTSAQKNLSDLCLHLVSDEKIIRID